MERSERQENRKKKVTGVKTFEVPFAIGDIKENITITTKIFSNLSKEQIINQAFKFHSQGNTSEAAKLYQYFINQGFNDHRVFCNYGVILKTLGKLKEAELLLRKAIKLKPNFSDAHSNLGDILWDLGELQEAEILTRKAIRLNPNFAHPYSNLGNILKDLGKLKEAKLCFQKAIKLNPNFVNAHYNLGNILKDLGKLKEAELCFQRAIKLNPDLIQAHLNLTNILKNLGKLQELINLTKSTLKLKSINEEYKLTILLRVTIANLIQGDFSETLLNLNRSNKLINKGVLNNIEDEINRKHISTFSNFITSLYPLLEKENKHPHSEKIPHLGESHCFSFAHQTISLSSQVKTIQPVLITGAKAWHFANQKNNQWKDSLTQQIKHHNYSDEIFITFGEIDCRKNEGILNYAIKNNKDISEVCEKTIKGYLDYMEEILSPNYSKKYYFGVPAPTRKKELLDDLDIKRIEMIKKYNSLLKQEVLSRGSYFLDVYSLTSTETGENNNLHMCDQVHLSPKCLSILFDNYLYKR